MQLAYLIFSRFFRVQTRDFIREVYVFQVQNGFLIYMLSKNKKPAFLQLSCRKISKILFFPIFNLGLTSYNQSVEQSKVISFRH